MSISEEAKALIDEETEILSSVVQSLEHQAFEQADRLGRETVRARELTAQIVAARRDEDKQMLASDEAVSHSLVKSNSKEIESIEKLIDKPYFARVVLEEEVNGSLKNIEYKLGFASNLDCRIIDWRKAPIARLYYEYNEGDEYLEEIQGRERSGKVVLRNKVHIENARLKRLNCRFGTFVHNGTDWQTAGGRFRDSSDRSYGQLPDILSLITPEQFKMITEDADTAILIQGVAGSGKTTVALHRLAWLLHEDNSDLKPEESLILVLNPTLRQYIKQSLPMLEMSKVNVRTFSGWAADALKQLTNVQDTISRPLQAPSLGTQRVKGSMAMLRCIEGYAESQWKRTVEYSEQAVPWNLLGNGARQSLEDFRAGKSAMLPFLENLHRAIKSEALMHAPDSSEAQTLSDAAKDVDSVFRRCQLYTKDILFILSRPQQLLSTDETKLLDKEVIAEALAQTQNHFDSGTIDYLDDALILRLGQLKWGSLFASRIGTPAYRHIVADEVQDFSVPQLAVVVDLVKELYQLTLAGDTAQQTTTEGTFPGWDRLRKFWSMGDDLSRYVQLSISHRSTLPIMRLADHVAGNRRTKEGRQGRRPLWFHCRGEGEGVQHIVRWLEKVLEQHPGSLAAVVCANREEAHYAHSLLEPAFGPIVRLGDDTHFTFDEGVCVTFPEQIKGLEFPHVLLWNPSRRSYPTRGRMQNYLYIAITRAEDHLGIVTWSKPTKYLPHIHSRLVRGVDRTELDEE
jgi:DNA helicase-2/ATP-dependent DNA helicase PcrA